MYFSNKTAFCLGLALILLLSCSDNSDIAFPSKDDVRQRYSNSTEISSSSESGSSSSELSSSSIDVSGSSSSEISSSSEQGSSSSELSSSSIDVSSSSSSVDASSSSSNTSSSSEQNSSSSVEQSSSSVVCQNSNNTSQSPTPYDPDTHFCDGRDGKIYKWIKIDNQIWMAENLNFYVSGSTCYDNIYGRLYNWATAMSLPSKCNSTLSTSDADCKISTPNHKGVCPDGWHIPSDAEWDALINYVDSDKGCGSVSCAGKHLKATGGWNSDDNGQDTYGFSALPGGHGLSDGYFYYVGDYGYWWSATESNAINAYYRDMDYSHESVYRYGNLKSYYLFSVRCLQD